MRPGEPFGRYVLTRELGRGGMGVVFAARDPALGREVAIKVVLAPAPPADLLERFRLEAATAARLSHPGVVKVHEAGVERGRPYFVQELVEGESLQARLDRAGPLPPVEAARLVRELALAVEHAHAQGVLHRDLKPANALVTPAGRVCLVDFGLAKDALAGGDLTRTGELLGTLGFMAPEQAGDGAKRVDARADVYGLGATLYALLTGRPPFAGGSPVQVVRRLLEEPPTPPTRERPEVPPALEALVLRCLAKEPGRRPASAADLAAALDACLAGGPPRRRPRLAPALLAGALLAAVAAALPWGRAPEALPVEPAPPAADPPPARAWRWRRVEAAGEGPAPRYAVAAAYDPRRQAVRFAGGWAREAISEVWAWDGAWSRERSLPAGRYTAGLAANDRQVVFLGGDDVDRRACDDVWVLGGDAGWRRGTRPAGPGFGGRHAVVHAPDRATFLVFGGRPAALWEWAGADDWRTHGCLVPARAGAAVAYDAARRRLVVFGGEEAPDRYLDDLWEWDGRAWAPGPGGPPARTNAMLTFDGARCLLFGGAAQGPGNRWEGVDDLWAWDGQVWEALATEGERPGARARGGFAWDPRRGVGVLFGGVAGSGARSLGDLWELVPP